MAFDELLKLFRHGVAAVHPAQLISKNIILNKSNSILHIVDKQYDLTERDLFLVGAGKAVYHMAQSLVEIVGSKIRKGILSVPAGSIGKKFQPHENITYLEGAKDNMPDYNSFKAAQEIENLVKNVDDQSLLIVLLSGGGSALLPLPVAPVTLEEKTSLIKDLARSGASITELNVVRKKLSALKGGKLALLAPDTNIATLILSDVIGDPIDLIASGPTVYNDDPKTKAASIIEKYSLQNKIPTSIHGLLYNKNEDKYKQIRKKEVSNFVIGNNSIALNSMRSAAVEMGYDAFILSDSVQGDVEQVAHTYLNIIKLFCMMGSGEYYHILMENLQKSLDILETKKEYLQNIIQYVINGVSINPVCLILGGEPTVKITGHGKGGRNQELALRLSSLLHYDSANSKSVINLFQIKMLCAGTDGIDGPTDAAGACGYSTLADDALKQSLDPEEFILNNDSYTFYNTFDNGKYHIKIGHTNTNVMDIHIITLEKKNITVA